MKKNSSKLYGRRFFLKSSSAIIALPFLQSLPGSSVFAEEGRPETAVGSPTSSSGIPKRLIVLPMGYGVCSPYWFPALDQVGKKYELPPLVKPFEAVKNDISFLQNLQCARIPDPHAGTNNFLTCTPGKSRRDKNFRNGVSCDQLAAETLGGKTRFKYMAMGSSGGPDGHGGYASWDRAGTPVGLHRTTTDIYTALFGNGGGAEQLRAKLAHQQSSLDAVLSDAKRLNRQVNAEDRDRIDEYFTSIRNIESRLSRAMEWTEVPYPKAPFQLKKDDQEIDLVFDMMLAAMKSDSTRVMTYMLPTAVILKMMGSKLNPHRMSHGAKGEWDPKNPTEHQKRDLMLAEMVSGFIKKLKETKEADGSSLLDHSLVVYGSCLRQGHAVSNGPLILAGQGGGKLHQGQNINMNHAPLANLWLSILRHVGGKQDRFANSTGTIKEMGFV